MIRRSVAAAIMAGAVCALAAPGPALAYVGPGAGISLIGSTLGLLVALATAVGIIILWPLRSLLNKRGLQERPASRSASRSGSVATPEGDSAPADRCGRAAAGDP